jgi:hypothetical protein
VKLPARRGRFESEKSAGTAFVSTVIEKIRMQGRNLERNG